MELEKLLDKINNTKGILLYFSKEGCNVCHALKPKIKDALAKNFPQIEFIFIDAQKSPDVAAHFNVFSVPTMILFLESKEFLREGRAVSISQFIEKVKRPYQILFS